MTQSPPTALFQSSDMLPKPVEHSLTLCYFADLGDLAQVMDFVHSSEFLDYHLEARSADRWTALRVFAREDSPVPAALRALSLVHETAVATSVSQ